MGRHIEVITAPPVVGQPLGEVGRITDLTDAAQTILLQREYLNPVVFAQSASRNGGHPIVVRVTDVQADRFTLYLQEPPDMDGIHGNAETVSYVVLESGEWRLDDGRTLEVGTAERYATVDWFIDPDPWETVASTADSTETPSRGRYSQSR